MKRHRKIFYTAFLGLILFAHSASASLSSNGLEKTGSQTGHETDLDLKYTIGFVINVLLSFVGVFFLLLMIYGGYTWMLARGNEQEIEKAKNIIRNSLIGLVIIMSAYGITYLIMNGSWGD